MACEFEYPIGQNPTQTLSIGEVSLTLEHPEFNPTELNNWGYKRVEDSEGAIGLSRTTISGTPVVSGAYWTNPLMFEWSLQLNWAKAELLYALWRTQQYRIKNHQLPLTDQAVIVQDRRIGYTGILPRQRAIIGAEVTDPPAPPGFFHGFCLFAVFLEIDDTLKDYLGRSNVSDLWSGKIKGKELFVVDPANDV